MLGCSVCLSSCLSPTRRLQFPPKEGAFQMSIFAGDGESLEQYTQEDEACTQMEPFNEEDMSSQGGTGNNPGGVDQRAWGRLISLGDAASKTELLSRAPKQEGGPCNQYWLGRGKTCDIRVDDARVSSQHCFILCEEVREAGRVVLKAFIEDNSSNGTFINGDVKLRKGQRRALNSGDEICLIKCRDKKEQEACSFVFQLLNSRPARRGNGLFSPFKPVAALRSSPSGSLGVFGGGRRIEEHYDIRGEIGRGTSGRVHIGVNRKTGEEFAVKVIETRRFGLTPGLSPKELVQEAEVLRAIQHPSIVKLQDIFQSEGAIYLVMELVRGGDLFDRILERGRYTESAARQIMLRILNAVQYLHARDIVHRDLKPENILLVHKDCDVEVKITDFGLAKRTTREGLKTFCGTPQYFAPEVLKRRNSVLGTGRYGREADMWSVGVILYILLSGTPPFDDNTLFDQIRTASYSFQGQEWEGVSDEAKDLVRKLLTTSPVTRLKADQALRHPWFAAMEIDSSSSPSQSDPLSLPLAAMRVQEHLASEQDASMSSVQQPVTASPSPTGTAVGDDEDDDMQDCGFGSIPPLAVNGPVTVLTPSAPSSEPRRRKSLHPKPLALQLAHAPTARQKRQSGQSARTPAKAGKKKAGDKKTGVLEGGGELQEDKIMDYSSSEEPLDPVEPFSQASTTKKAEQPLPTKPPAAGASNPSRAMFPPPPRIPGSSGKKAAMGPPAPVAPMLAPSGAMDVKVNQPGPDLASPPVPSPVAKKAAIPQPSPAAAMPPPSTTGKAARNESTPGAKPVPSFPPPPAVPAPSQPCSTKKAGASSTKSSAGRKRATSTSGSAQQGTEQGSSGSGKRRRALDHPQDASQRTLHQFLTFRGDPSTNTTPGTASR